jgi:hypothetical protein
MKYWLQHFFTHREHHTKALEEVFFVNTLSLIPLFLLPLAVHLKAPTQQPLTFAIFWDAINNGQLFLYSFSLFGTIFWLCLDDPSDRKFAPRKYLMLAAVLPAIVILVIYSFDPSLTKKLDPHLVSASIFFFLLYTFLYYISLVFSKLRAPDLQQTLENDTIRLMKDYRREGDGS